MNEKFNPGVEVSAFIKNSNKIWEGILVDRSDGTKVVLNETTKTWKRLSDLESVKLIEADKFSMENQKITNTADIVKQTFSDIKLKDKQGKSIEKLASDPGLKDTTIKSLTTIAQGNPNIKDKDKANEDDITKMVDNEMMNTAGEEASEQNSSGDTAGIDAAKEAMDDVKDKIAETLSMLHPSLQPHLQEEVDEADLIDFMRDKLEGGNFDRKSMEQIKDYLQDNDAAGTQDDEKDIDYENEDYLDIPDEVKQDVIKKVKELLADNCEDIEDKIKSSFELTDDDAEEFIAKAMEEWLEESDIEIRDSIKIDDEEIEKDFEDTIDKYDGPNDGLLDHLTQEYEIDPDEAEKIYDEKKGDLTECVFEFVKIVHNRLNEGFLDSIKYNKDKPYHANEEDQIESWLHGSLFGIPDKTPEEVQKLVKHFYNKDYSIDDIKRIANETRYKHIKQLEDTADFTDEIRKWSKNR